MNTQVSNSFWEELQQIISRVSKGFDKDWQKRSRAIDTQFLVSFIFKLVLSKNKQGYSSIMSDLWGAADQDSCIKLPQEKPFAASSVCEARQKMPENILFILHLYEL